jgi:hypothetical protein
MVFMARILFLVTLLVWALSYFKVFAAEGVLELIPPQADDDKRFQWMDRGDREDNESKRPIWTVLTTYGGVRFFSNPAWVESFKEAIASGRGVKITLRKARPTNDDDGRPKQQEEIYLQNIDKVEFLNEPADLLKHTPGTYLWDDKEIPQDSMISIKQNFTPTNMKSLAEAERVFDSLNQNFNPVIKFLGKTVRKEAQCWRKAFVWNYQMNRSYGINSYKVFLFYSERFYRAYPYNRIWDFHVAPIVIVRGIPMVFDPRFFYTPVNLKDWKNEFIDNHAPCKIMHHYSERDRDGLQEWCFLRIVPQYYLQPPNIVNYDDDKTIVDTFQEWDVKNAYKEFRK